MRKLAVLALIVLASCGPTVIWSGRTPDRLHRVEVVRDSDLDFVVVDGQRRAAYRGVAGWSIALAGSHIAFAARVAGRWVVIHDGKISSEKWDGIGELKLSPDGRLVYVAQRAGGWHVVTADSIGPRVDAVLKGSLKLAGSHVAYVAQSGRHVRAVVDGKLGEPFDGIGQLALDAQGHYVYAGRRALDAYVVADGVLGPRSDGVSLLELGPHGHHAYVATFAGATRLVRDRELGPAVDAIHYFLFRDDGTHVAWIGKLDGLEVLALDDKPIATWPARRSAKIAFRPTALGGTGTGLAYVLTNDDGERLVIDELAHAVYDEVRPPVWSKDGRMAYAARRGRQWLIIDGEREIDAGDAVGDPVVAASGAGTRLAYAGRRGTRSYVAVDGRTFAFDLVFEDTVAFSADGTRWGAVAGDRAREQLFIVIDGKERIPITVRELYSAVASGGDDSALREWTRAELERPRATRESRR